MRVPYFVNPITSTLFHHFSPRRAQVTVFPAILALDARRELRTRLGVGCPGFGCSAPCCCSKDPAEEQLLAGNNGWTAESNVYKHDHAAAGGPTQGSAGAQNAAGGDYSTQQTFASSASGLGGQGEPSGSPRPLTPTKRVGSQGPGTPTAAEVAVKVMVRPPSPEKQQIWASPAPPRDFTTPTISCWGRRVFNPHDDQFSTKLVARWLPAVSLNKYGKFLVIVLECIMLGFAIYGCTKVYMDFNFRGTARAMITA
jgi:hypothetical protein